MNFNFLKRRKFWKRLILWLIAFPVVLFFTVVIIAYWKQDAIVQELISNLNADFTGEIEVEDSHINLFENFPYISIELEHVAVYEDKDNHKDPIVGLESVFAGFDLWTILTGTYDIKILELKNGYIHIVQHVDGELNLTHALSSNKPVEEVEEDFNIHLKSITLIDVDIYKLNESSHLIVESFIDQAELSFKTSDEHVFVSVEAQMELNVIKDGDTTFFKHKQLSIESEVDYIKETEYLVINPSELELGNATFTGEGTIAFADDFNLDLKLYAKKQDFELFKALAPEEIYPVLDRYEDAGEIIVDVQVKGKAGNGNTPAVDASFSCTDAHIENNLTHKRLDELNFSGSFTNNGMEGLAHMEFRINDFSAKPEAGTFSSNLVVKNFDSPDIDMTLDSDFDLEFLASFINITSFDKLDGDVQLHMKFHDIIDLTRPEKSIEKLNEAYYTEILIDNLSFTTPAYHLPLDDLDLKITVEGHEAQIDYFRVKVGHSDFEMSGHFTDLPAILHHTNDVVTADLTIKSKLLDIEELTRLGDIDSLAVNEKIDDFSMKLKFVTTARNFTESPHLPVGEFFIEDLFATLEHYPHTLHDFHGDLFVEDSNFRIIDFSGMIDESDFHFSGQLMDYERWLEEHPKGDTRIEFDLTSDQLQLEDLFSYGGENYVPEDYRHEVLNELKLHGAVDLHFNDGFRSLDLRLTQLDAKMKVHPMKFKNFNGRIHFEDEHIVVEALAGQIGKSKFNLDMNYYLGEDEAIRKRDNHLGLRASQLDMDELFNYNDPPGQLAPSPSEHEEVFNIYELPFSLMTIDLDIDHLNYHRYVLDDLHARLRTTPDHYLYIDTMRLHVAGGRMELAGYFNGSNKDKIYFSPNLKLKGIDLEKLLFKFENFGQDHLISENIKGKITSTITGKVHMHADMVPILDDSEVHIDLMILNGSLLNYAPIVDLKDYFIDKNVNTVRFDTLKNHIDFKNGTINIPEMTINSSLGYLVISGMQDVDYNMEYYIRVPLSLIASAGFKTLFGKDREEVDPQQEDEIEYAENKSLQSFVNIKIVGDADDYAVSLGKDKRTTKRD